MPKTGPDRLLDAAQSSLRAGSMIQILMLQALAHEAQGKQQLAQEALDRILTESPKQMASPGSFSHRGRPHRAPAPGSRRT